MELKLTHRDELLSFISDAHKGAYGFRPRDWSRYMGMTDDELNKVADYLSEQVALEIEREELAYAESAYRFEQHIATLMSDHNIDRGTAIRWDMDAIGMDQEELEFYGMSYYAWRHGLRTTYFDN